MDSTYSCFPSFFKYTNMQILLILLDMDRHAEDSIVSPSKYIAEMTCSTSERLEKLRSISRKEKIRVEKALNMLKAIPDMVVFQNYSIGDAVTIPVHILNTYETSKPVRVVLDPNTVFSITCPSGIVNTKVAPGMAYQVNVIFQAHEQKDYRHYLNIISEGESFFIPLVCISRRPLLDIPDRIILPTIPVKIASERTIIVRNLGEVRATFNIRCSPDFVVEPSRGFVDPHDYMQLTIRFQTDTVGDHQGHLILTQETGEVLTVMLEATSYESNIFLDSNELEPLDTYMSLKRKKCVKLYNNSEHIVSFAWKRNRNAEEDRLENAKYEESFRQIKEVESRKYADLLHQGIIAGGDTNEVICERIYRDELREYRMNQSLMYNDLNWGVRPLTGQIWPNNFASFIITFAPTEAKYYKTTMYLEVSGKEERLPLRLYGAGKGPQIGINISELNASDIFLCSKHQYEISVRNEGHIPGTIEYVPRPLLFGGTANCKPKYNYMDPNRYASFVLSFSSNVQGKFVEEIEFIIQESGEVKKIVFRGNIVCPLLNFDVKEINFGKITLGYPVSTYINLINTTQVPIEYVAKFTDDGNTPALSCIDYANQSLKSMITSPKELCFQPEQFTVLPNLTSKAKLTLLPNHQGDYVKRLIIVMWGTPKYSISLPIIYKCEIPDVVSESQDIFMRGCFVNYVYTRSITIRNRNEHPGYFQFLPYDVEGPTDIVFEPKPAEDFIEGYGMKEVELSIFTRHIGQSTLKVYISIFGGVKRAYLCTIRCNGQGPVITVPEVLYFEDIRTLKSTSQYLKIVNDSPVPATVTVTHNKKLCCTINEDLLTLNPSESLDLEIKAYVRVPGQFTDKIIFTTEEGESQSSYIKITAVGSSILCEPEIEPELNLGAILTHQTFTLNVKFTNMSKKYHKLIWTRLKKLKSFRDDPASYEGSLFSLRPNVFDLAPDQSMNCLLSGYGCDTGPIEEDFYCHAIIEGKRDHAVITNFLVVAEFVRPMLQMSHNELHFRIDTGVDKTSAFLVDTMTVKNISKLAITTNISIEEPFFILSNNPKSNSMERHLENGDVFSFEIEFEPKAARRECVVWNKELVFTYLGHPYKDKIPVKGEENFPNLEIEPMFIDFECLPNFFTTSTELIIKNVSPLPLTFQWEWLQEKIEVNKIPAVPGSEESVTISTISEPTFSSCVDIHDMSSEDYEDEGVLYRRIEIDVVPPKTLTKEIMEAQPTEHAIISTVESTPEYKDEFQLVIYQLVNCYGCISDQTEIEVIKCLPKTMEECRYCCEVFDLVPAYGYLGPYEAQMVSMEFSPYPNSLTTATAYCHPTGGKTEVLNIKGGSSNISFSVDSNIIEFGRQLFCEICEQSILITNTGYAPLNIEPFENEEPESELEGCLPPPNWYNVNLKNTSKDYELRVRYFPGVTREFSQKFFLQIGYLPTFSLTIHGYGVLQQIFCALPRPSMDDEIISFLSYKAIGSITTPFLKDVKLLTQTDIKRKNDIPYNVRESLKNDDWVIISFDDEYPTVTDIQMALERCMIDLYLSSHYELLYDHTVLRNSTIVSNKLVAAPYLTDFQYVIRDTEVYYTATVLNYGPDVANLRTIWARKMAIKYGFRAKLAHNSLQVGASTELCIYFNPTIKVFPTENNLIYETLFILVSHGQKIPIEMKAHVTIPTITVNEKLILFSEVNLGCCLRRDITLENTGYVPCNWEAKIEMEGKNTWKPVFHCKTTSGTLAVGEKILLDLYFEPMKDGKFRGCLAITVNQNPNKIVLKLKGTGIKPILKISEHKLCFPSTLPYTENVEVTFSIENISKSPIEFYFCDFDDMQTKIQDVPLREGENEDLILNVLMEYYKVNHLAIPYRQPGDALPIKILEFYANLVKSLKEKLNEISFKSEFGSISDAESKLLTPKRRGSVASKRSDATSNVLLRDPLALKTPDEILTLLKEHLRELKQQPSTKCPIELGDPVGSAIDNALKHNDYKPPDAKTGILLIFHGALKTEYLRAANRAGLELKLPVVSVDKMILDALLYPSTLAAIKVRQIVDEAFYSVASETDLQVPPNYDDYEFLQKKVDLLLSGKKKKTVRKTGPRENARDKIKSATVKKSSEKNLTDDKVRKGKQSKNKKDNLSVSTESTKSSAAKIKIDKRPTLIGISEDLLFEIIESQLTLYGKGVIVEGLDSVIIKRPMTVLHMLLKDYIAKEDRVKQRNVETKIKEKLEEIEKIMDMDAESYANLSAEDMALFKGEVLLPRKEKSRQRHEELLLRIAAKKNKRSKQKGKQPSKTSIRRFSKGTVTPKETKKKSKSSDSKSSKTSKSSRGTSRSKGSSGKGSKKGGKEKGKKLKEKISSADQELKKAFINSETLICEILHTLEYWDRKQAILTKPMPVRVGNKQSSKKSKSTKSKSSMSSFKSVNKNQQANEKEEGIIKIYSPAELETASYIGIPCWLVENAAKETNYAFPERICLFLQHTNQLTETRSDINDKHVPVLMENSILLSVLQKPRQREEKNTSNEFDLMDVGVPIPKDKLSPMSGHDSKRQTKRRGSVKRNRNSASSLDRNSAMSIATSIKTIGSKAVVPRKDEIPEVTRKVTPRVVINPSDKYIYKATFAPKHIGTYSHTFTIELAGWPTRYYIECNGMSELPNFDMDPKVMFEKVIDEIEGVNPADVAFFLNEKILDFGTVLLPNMKEYKDKLPKTATKLKFVNKSSLVCETQIFLTEDRVSSGVFSLDTAIFSVQPGESTVITISSSPLAAGAFCGFALILIKNNPEVQALQLRSSAVNVNVVFEPKLIDFERSTLNCAVKKWTKLYNFCPIPITWRASEFHEVQAHFKICPLSGRVQPSGHQKIEFTFKPLFTEDIPRKCFKIIVLDGNRGGDHTLCTETLGISAEVINIQIECPKDINFGEIKGRMDHQFNFPILSKIKYNMDFMFTDILTHNSHKAIRDLFRANPKQVQLKYGKISNVCIAFSPKRYADFVNLPIFHCVVSDPATNTVVMSFDLTATATVHCSRFKLCPKMELDFSHQLIGCEKSETIFLENQGKFEFSYVVVSVSKMLNQSKKKKKKEKKGKKSKKGSKQSKAKSSPTSKSTSKGTNSVEVKSKKSSKSSKESKKGKKGKKDKRTPEKKSKPKPTKLSVNCFTLISSTGILEPGESTLINVTAKPTEVGVFEEKFLIFISECEPAHRKGIPILFTCTGITPKYNFTDFTDIFYEQYVVNSMADFNCPEQICGKQVFVIEENTLHLNKVCINYGCKSHIRIKSASVVTTTLAASIGDETFFSIAPATVIVEPYCHAHFVISFTPNAIKSYECTLKLDTINSAATSSNQFLITITGEGYVPDISIVEPPLDATDGSYNLNFPPLLVGERAEKTVVFENTCLIPCKVILELWNETSQMLLLSCDEPPEEDLFDKSLLSTITVEDSDDPNPFKHHMLVKLEPNATVAIRIVFEPNDEVSGIALLRLYVVNNPYEVYNVNISMESYMEDIILNGLSAISIQNRAPNVISRYELNFGFCTLNSLKHKRFTIKNNSSFFIYRFQFPSFDKLKFSPTIGHLKPKSSKQVLVTFFAASPINLVKEPMHCSIAKIEYVSGDMEPLSWDDRQNVVVWREASEYSLVEKRSVSAPLSARRLQRKSSVKLVKKSGEDVLSIKRSSSIIRPNSRRSSSNLSTSDTKKSKTDASSLSYKERKIESKPEPPYATLAETPKNLEFILSMTADYCTYECSVRDIVIQDTLMFEKRTATFQIKNTSTMPLELNWCIIMDECFPRRINCSNDQTVKDSLKSETDTLANIVQSKRLVKSAAQKRVCLSGNERFLSGNCTPAKSCNSSTIFSDDGSITNRSRDSWHESDYMPFSIEPSSCTIPPINSMDFKITFSPIDVFQYVVHLRSNTPNLVPNDPGLEVIVQAKSLLPLYHFDILPSDYLLRRQRLCGDIVDENTKVVEFDGVGLNMQHIRKFSIINPTGENFNFRWKPSPLTNNEISLFHCNTPEGNVTKGKMAEASFTFVPRKLGTFETFYTFIIEKYNIETMFLLTGIARNPCVFFSTSYLTLEGTLANVEVTDTIVLHNKDDLTLNFQIRKSSSFNNDRTRKIIVEPMDGTLTPRSSLPISLKFKSAQTGDIDFKLKCDVERMSKPLILTVKSSVYDVEAQAIYFIDNQKYYLDPKAINIIELKTLFVQQEDRIRFEIVNTGKIGFYYNWHSTEKSYEDYALIEIDPSEGYCSSLVEAVSYLVINPCRPLIQKRFKVILQLLYGPKYIINFICTTAKINYKFSFHEYDFGKCILQNKRTTYYNTTLQFTNLDQQPLTLEYENNDYDCLSIVFNSNTIQAKHIEKIPIYFHPQEVRNYSFVLRFYINSKVNEIIVKGEGTPLIIELIDQEQKFINLGAVLADKQVIKVVQVINRSNAKICALFDLYERLPIHSEPKKVLEAAFEREEVIETKEPKLKKNKKNKKGKGSRDKKTSKKGSASSKKSKNSKSTKTSKSSKSNRTSKKSSKSSKKSNKEGGTSDSSSLKTRKGRKDKEKETLELVEQEHKEDPKEVMKRLINESLEIIPKICIRMSPGDTHSFTIIFTPKQKLVSFTKKLFCQVQDHLEPLCLVKGSCIAADYYLDRNKISFATVSKGESNAARFSLFNTGDIGGKYKWKFEKVEPSMTIEPSEGYISPDMSITFTAKYNPKTIQCSATARARCVIEHFKNPLRIQFTGSCINKSAAAGTFKFKCPVRTEATQIVTYENKMTEHRLIKPKIVGAHFRAQEFVDLQPLSSATCEIHFCPTVMSTSEQPHKATFRLDLPDGRCLIYNLEGIAEVPLPCNVIERDINCKTQFVETFEIQNWLKTPQQFKVITENTKPNQSKLILYKTTGNCCIDVSASGKRQYKWGIFVMNVGTLYFRVIFKNEATKEYLFYEIQLNVKQGGPLAEISLVTCVRVPKVYKLTLENPLKKEVTFTITSNCERLEYVKFITANPLSEAIVDIAYFPLLPGVMDANLEVTTKELGVFLYHFHLEAADPAPEPPVVFKCSLGNSEQKKIQLNPTTRSNFQIKVQDKPIFTVDREIPLFDNTNNEYVTITFEPSALGNIQSSLTLTSPTGGQYLYPLIGTCTNPTPQGPIIIKLGASTTFIFKNPFDYEVEFTLRVEPEVFQVKPVWESIPGKRSIKIVISILNLKHDVIDNRSIPYTGKLIITCLKEVPPNLKWIYYLQSESRKNLATHT